MNYKASIGDHPPTLNIFKPIIALIRPKASGLSSRYQGGRVTGKRQDRDKMGTRQRQNRDKTGIRWGQDRVGARQGKNRDKTETRYCI